MEKTAASPLLIRHRYQNPFPPPPFPPKLLHISTDPCRYAGFRFLRNLENEREIPVIADADLGMPIELGLEADGTHGLGAYWEGNRNVICPDPASLKPPLDPEDMALLAEPPPAPGSSVSIINGGSQNNTLTVQGTSHPSSGLAAPPIAPTLPVSDRRKAEVSWLRRTEYFNNVQHKSRTNINNPKNRVPVPVLPKTKTERLVEIHSTFEAVSKQPFQDLKHPTKSHLKAIDAYEFLPNESIWANTYDLYRFPENPTDRPDQTSSMSNTADERLEHAILRPFQIKGDTILAYYLSDSPEGASNYKRIKQEKNTIDDEDQADQTIKEDAPEAQEPIHELHFVREYEISQQRPLNQYLLILDEGQTSGLKKAAYFNPVGQFRTLRKRRPKLNEQILEDEDGNPLWDGISVLLSTDPRSIESTKVVRRELLSAISEPPNRLQS